MELYISCKNGLGKVPSTDENVALCKSLIEKMDWELSGLNSWIYFGEERIELFVDSWPRDNDESVDEDDDKYSYSYDTRAEDDLHLTFDEWYEKNAGIDQLISTRIDQDFELNDDYLDWSDDDGPFEELVKIFGDFILVVESDDNIFEFDCSSKGVNLSKIK